MPLMQLMPLMLVVLVEGILEVDEALLELEVLLVDVVLLEFEVLLVLVDVDELEAVLADVVELLVDNVHASDRGGSCLRRRSTDRARGAVRRCGSSSPLCC